jgi:hypothetical protein
MAFGALLRSVVVDIRGMTRQTKGSGGRQTVHGFRFMTPAAPRMRINGSSMGVNDLRSLVAIGTGTRSVACSAMVLLVACETGPHLDLRLQADGFRMALHASDFRVGGVFEPDPASACRMVLYCHLHDHLLLTGQLRLLVAGAALRTSRALVVADLAAARRLEGQIAAA